MNPKQKSFAQEYIIDDNGAKAAIRAGYSKKTAPQKAYELLKDPDIKAYIEQLKAKQAKRTETEADFLIGTLKGQINTNIKYYFKIDDNGDLLFKSLDKIPDELTAHISEISQTKTKAGDVTIKLKLYDKQKAIDMLMKHYGYYLADNRQKNPELEHRGEMTAEQFLQFVMKKKNES